MSHPSLTGIEATGLTGGYTATDEVVRGVDLAARPGELACIIGPNGAGKSTALKLVAGLLRPRAGTVRLQGRDLTGLSPQHVLAAGLGFVPQERNVFGQMSVDENLRMGAFHQRRQTAARLAETYARFPILQQRRHTLAGSLSGGQRQVLAMAAVLIGRPQALLLDEPTAGLSPIAAAELLTLVADLARSGLAILMVEQNALAALAVSDRAFVLVDGRLERTGPARDIAADPTIRRLFLGDRTTPEGQAA